MPQTGTDAAARLGRTDRGGPRDRVYRSLLLDFYGELLPPRQRECCELHYNEDLSLSEIAETCGISRQGAWDNIRRGTETLEGIESKTGLLRRQEQTAARLRLASEQLRLLEARCAADGELHALARAASEEIRLLLEDVGGMEHGV